jgi:hypothetical protein
MLNILGSQKRLCDGVTRRDMLQAGASAVLGLGLADLVHSPAFASGSARPRNFGAAKNVMVLYLYGAMSQIDTLDPKPDALAEIRGPFGTLATRLPGVRVGEHLPRIADRLDRVTVVRSMNHPEPIHNVANTVTPEDYAQTIYAKLGLDRDKPLYTSSNRPVFYGHTGKPIQGAM